MKIAAFWVVAPCSLAARTSETSVNFYQTTRRYNPEDSHLQQSHCLHLYSDIAISNKIWTGRVARWQMHIQFKSENLKVRNNLGGLGVDGRIILKTDLNTLGVLVWVGFIWLRKWSSRGV
jgi:hypothetical protein